MVNNQPMNAVAKFRQVVKRKGWHGVKGDKALQMKANRAKQLLLAGKLSYERCAEWLQALGYEKVQEEIWTKKQ